MFLLLMDLIFLLLQLSSSFLKGCWILWMFCCWVLEFCSLTLKNVEFCFGRQLSNLQISLELSSFVYKLCYGRCKTAFSAGLGLWLLFSLSVKTDSFVIPWIVACQPPLSMGFPKQEYLSGLPFPSPGIFLIQWLNLCLLLDRWVFLNHWATWEVLFSFRGLHYRSWRIRILTVFLLGDSSRV